MYRWCRGSANGLRIRRRLINPENLDGAKQAIIVSNHLSALDILVIGGYLRRDYRWLAKSSLFKVPFSGWYLRMAGHIPVHREQDPEARKQLVAGSIAKVVQQGASILIFPEGTRSDDGELQSFRMGAFMAAQTHRLPVLPLVIRGTHHLMEKGAKDLSVRPDRECSVTVLKPIHPKEETDEDVLANAARLRDACFQAMLVELERPLTEVNL